MNSVHTFPNSTALLIIDVQKGLDDPYYGIRCYPEAEQNMRRILAGWRDQKRPVVHVQHLSVNPESPLYPDKPGCAIKEEVQPVGGELLFQKNVNSAFIGTGLEDYLKEQSIDTLLIVGLTTEHCVSTSVRMAANLGFDVWVVDDATAAFDCVDHTGTHHKAEDVHAISLATLNGEFATVLRTEDVLLNIGYLSE